MNLTCLTKINKPVLFKLRFQSLLLYEFKSILLPTLVHIKNTNKLHSMFYLFLFHLKQHKIIKNYKIKFN